MSNFENIAVIGSSGAIGGAFTRHLSNIYPDANINAFSSHKPKENFSNVSYNLIDYGDESSIEDCASIAAKKAPLDIVVVATGMLHDDVIMPEKSLKELSAEKFQKLFEVNTIVPALIAKYFLPKLNRENRSIFAALSARVGSISDNQIGGWYSYRASKSALNMIIKNAAIEVGRINKNCVIVGLQPGTVDSDLSKPFQRNIREDKLFSPEYSVKKLIEVLKNLQPNQSGKCFAWNGEEVEP